ncbi:MAG TPA: hypothetical protein DEV87_01650 [Clostridiales bacterium]|nr:hypothetical protein [Clostridiales bacterium]
MFNAFNSLLTIVKKEVFGGEEGFDEQLRQDENLIELFKTAKRFDMTPTVAFGLRDCEFVKNEKAIKYLERERVLAVSRYERLEHDVTELKGIFEREKLPFIMLKGAVIRKMYPNPAERTSCDVDVLVKNEDLERAVSALTAAGYDKTERGTHDVGFVSPGGVSTELHFALVNFGQDAASKVLNDPFFGAVKGGGSEYALSPETFYFYHIAHAAKHFDGGFGIKPLVDLLLIKKNVKTDEEKLSAMLEAGGLKKFEENCVKIAEAWFCGGERNELINAMERHIERGGVYGSLENNVTVNQVRKKGKVRYFFSRMFLPYDKLKLYYPSLENRKILLPFYQVRRWFSLLFGGRVKRTVSEIQFNASVTKERREETEKLFSELGLL